MNEAAWVNTLPTASVLLFTIPFGKLPHLYIFSYFVFWCVAGDITDHLLNSHIIFSALTTPSSLFPHSLSFASTIAHLQNISLIMTMDPSPSAMSTLATKRKSKKGTASTENAVIRSPEIADNQAPVSPNEEQAAAGDSSFESPQIKELQK